MLSFSPQKSALKYVKVVSEWIRQIPKVTVLDNVLETPLPYLALPFLEFLALFTLSSSGWLFTFLIYGLLPLIDELFTLDNLNPNPKQIGNLLKKNNYFRGLLYLTVLLDWVLFVKILNFFSQLSLNTIDWLNFPAMMYMYITLSATQFTIAHEMFHKPADRLIGTLHMSKNLYMVFTYEHLYSHHYKVATPEDTASAPKNINLYSFVWGSFIGTHRNVYKMEKERIRKESNGRNRSFIDFFSNLAVLSIISSIIFPLVVLYFYGFQTFLLFLITAFGSIFLLEDINYIEHYGLRRKKLENGEYEKVTIKHSWNAPHRFTNYLLFKLQRHSDHHENSMKPYQTLLSLNESPELPVGYALCIFMAMFPKIWFKIMNPLVEGLEKDNEEKEKKLRESSQEINPEHLIEINKLYLQQKMEREKTAKQETIEFVICTATITSIGLLVSLATK